MRPISWCWILCLCGCIDVANEEDVSVASSELVTNPTVGGPFGLLATCSATTVYTVGPDAPVPGQVVTYMNNAAANWGHSNAPGSHPASSTGADGLGASKWYRGPNGNPNGGRAYWNNATQCAYFVPGSDASCIGSFCISLPNGTSAELHQKYASLSAEDGELGMPVSNPVPYGWAGVTYQLFTNGAITYHATYGAHYAGGTTDDARALARGWMKAFAVTPTWGPAVYAFMEDPRCTNLAGPPGSCSQASGKTGRFVRMWDALWGLPATILARTGWSEGYTVWGPHAQEWIRAAGAEPWRATGFPLGNMKINAALEETYVFEQATLIRKPWLGPSIMVTGAVNEFWSTDDQGNHLGSPTGSQTPTGDGGAAQSFASGNVYQTPAGATFAVEGGDKNPTLAAYLAAGGPSAWGYPVESSPLPGTQTYGLLRAQRFDGGIFVPTSPTEGYWSPFLPPIPGSSVDLHLTWGVNWTDLHWTNVSDEALARVVLRQINDGPWIQIMSLPVPATMTADNPATAAQNGFALRPTDSKVCYQIHVTLTDGRMTPSNTACHYTPALDTKAVGRVTIAIRTSTKADSDTDHRVRVRLQSRPNVYGAPFPRGNVTWIDNTSGNFDRGTTSSFDLSTKGISDLSDITGLVIEVPGDDALCVAGVDLMANDVLVFSKEYGEEDCAIAEYSGRHFLDGRHIVVGTFTELRAFPEWQAYSTQTGNYPPVLGIDASGQGYRFVGFNKEAFISKLNSMVADQMLEEASDPEGEAYYPRFDDGQHTITEPVPGFGDDTLQVYQFVQANDGWWGDVHCQLSYRLKIVPEFAGGPDQPSTGTHMDIPSETAFAHCWTEGFSSYIPLWSLLFSVAPAMVAESDFDAALGSMNGIALGTIPGDGHFCFGGQGSALIFGGPNGGMDPQSFSVCLGPPSP